MSFRHLAQYVFILAMALCLTFLHANDAVGAESCFDILNSSSAHALLIDGFPNLKTRSFSPRAHQSILERAKPFREKWGLGEGLHFVVSGDAAYDRGNPFWQGENIQDFYLGEVLKVIFPKAQFGFAKEGTPGRVHLTVWDFAEFGENDPLWKKQQEDTPEKVEMLLAKIVNATYEGIDRVQSRSKIGIRPNEKVLHIYGTVPVSSGRYEVPQIDYVQRLLEAVHQNNAPDVLILTLRLQDIVYPHFIQDLQNLGMLSHYPGGIHRLSTFTHEANRANQGRRILINDVTGLMPYLYAASNQAVILGPVNFMEPGRVGTPAIVLLDPERRSTYNLKALGFALDVAKQA